jgi:hypothetical protein
MQPPDQEGPQRPSHSLTEGMRERIRLMGLARHLAHELEGEDPTGQTQARPLFDHHPCQPLRVAPMASQQLPPGLYAQDPALSHTALIAFRNEVAYHRTTLRQRTAYQAWKARWPGLAPECYQTAYATIVRKGRLPRNPVDCPIDSHATSLTVHHEFNSDGDCETRVTREGPTENKRYRNVRPRLHSPSQDLAYHIPEGTVASHDVILVPAKDGYRLLPGQPPLDGPAPAGPHQQSHT